MKPIYLVLATLLLSGCSANWHLRQAVKKDPSILQDTVVQFDTTIIAQEIHRTDSFVTTEFDTIEVVTDSISYRIIRRRDTLRIDVLVPGDTVRITKEVSVPQYIYVEKETALVRWYQKLKWYERASLWLGGVIALLFVSLRVYRKLRT